jgi:hypothetical protein
VDPLLHSIKLLDLRALSTSCLAFRYRLDNGYTRVLITQQPAVQYAGQSRRPRHLRPTDAKEQFTRILVIGARFVISSVSAPQPKTRMAWQIVNP